VQEVIEMDASMIQPPPRVGTKLNTDFIQGMGKRNEQFVIILDIDKVFSIDDLQSVQSTMQNANAVEVEV
jgi:purine-binding chemotaxis protein CheW